MTWHIVVLAGADDAFFPPINLEEPHLLVVFQDPTNNWFVNNNVLDRIRTGLGIEPSPIVRDLLHIAMMVYSADLRVNRKHGIDRWSREFSCYVSVTEVQRWTQAADLLARMLHFLTGDNWTFTFRKSSPQATPTLQVGAAPNARFVSLFSGGLDSLVGAIDLLAAGHKVALVGHHGAGMTNAIQTAVLRRIQQEYGENVVPLMFYVQPPRSNVDDGETSMRSRSILFLSLGVAVATALGGGIPLVVSENGLISLNVPLTRSRTGSSATRTTHPYFLSLFRQLLVSLELNVPLETPYRFRTKGEMLRDCVSQAILQATAPLSMSCSHPEAGRYRGHSPGQHCGYCVPCIIRRASLHASGLPEGTYNIDVNANAPNPKTKTGRDFRAFQMALERLRGVRPSRFLFDVLSTGPIPHEEASQFADVYRRGMDEVRSLLE